MDDEYDMPHDHWNVIPLAYRRLKKMTDNFSEDNYIGDFQFGKVYRGTIRFINGEVLYVLVKIWEGPGKVNYQSPENELRLMDEMVLLRHERMIQHPGMLKLHGYCLGSSKIGAVYLIKSLDTVYNLVPKDGFSWNQRIKVALGIARLLKFLHTRTTYTPFLVRNVSASHIIVDEEFNPNLFDFGMVTGGIFPDRTIYPASFPDEWYDVIDPAFQMTGTWSEKNDVFSYGIVVLSLITKHVFSRKDVGKESGSLLSGALHRCSSGGAFNLVDRSLTTYPYFSSVDVKDSGSFHGWALRRCGSGGLDNLVDQTLTADPYFSSDDGHKITTLALSCISMSLEERPTMEQVVEHLLKLQVVKRQADFMAGSSSNDKQKCSLF